MLQYYMHLNGIILDITDVAQNCAVWSFLHKRCPAARCSEILTFKGGVLPVREECFAATPTSASHPMHTPAAPREPPATTSARAGGGAEGAIKAAKADNVCMSRAWPASAREVLSCRCVRRQELLHAAAAPLDSALMSGGGRRLEWACCDCDAICPAVH